MTNILLTGSNGFVGSYFKNKYSGKYNLNTFSFLNDNLEDLNLSNTNVIIHLSALVHQMDGASKEEYEKVNVTQTLYLANKARKMGVNHFIFMSTVAVYGLKSGVIDNNSKCNPFSDYGKSKLKAEKELLKLNNADFKISIIRPPIVNGYNAPGNMKSLINLIKKVPILPFGNIQNKRSMVYVGNLCHLIEEIIVQNKVGIFLACDDNPLSTTKLCELISKSLNKKVYLIKIPFFESLLHLVKPSFQKRLYESLEIDNRKTKKILNLSNPFSVEDSINFMIKGTK
ncbi:MAG: NAD-dependent epimerase/dehydratase family protein [Campylobacteraceae bacterium]|nr:NAD-dependent epimerase/dehydratase family protein [Campylobacteraceae bacterium]